MEAQQLNLMIRQPLHAAMSVQRAFKNTAFKTYRLNLATEYIPEDSGPAIIANFAYAYETTSYPSYYYRTRDNYGDYFKQSMVVGALGRQYWAGQTTTTFYAELGGHLHFIQRNEAIIIRTNYGRYEEISRTSDVLVSGSVGVGISAELFWNIRIEPSVQWILSSLPSQRIRQYESVFMAIGSEGILQEARNELHNSRAPFNQNVFTSLTLKVPLFR